jgi:hypothetical protein
MFRPEQAKSPVVRASPALIVLVTAGLAAAQAAGAGETSTARFLVSVRATVTKHWTYTSTQSSAGCRLTTNGEGARRISFRSKDVSVVTARWTGGRSRVRFSGSAGSLGGSIHQTGTTRTTSTGPAGCAVGPRRTTCTPITRTFHNRAAALVSGRLHKLSFRRMSGFVPDDFFTDCPGEPAAVRSVAGGLSLANGSFDERDLFNRSVGGLTLEGSADATTTLLNGSATIVHHVRWTLTLRRVGG